MAMKATKASQVPLGDLSSRAIATRDSLKQAAVDVINERGFSAARVEDVTIRAGVAKGLFYRYFTSINDITRMVCEDLFADILAQSMSRTYDGRAARYDWLLDYVRVPIDRFVKNRGLLACMFELHGSFPEISHAWQVTAHQWNAHLASFIARTTGRSERDAEQLCYVLGAVMEGIIYQAIVRNTPDLKRVGASARSIAETVTDVWFRIIFLEDPAREAA
jgi:AcrR family transcriptional regulator